MRKDPNSRNKKFQPITECRAKDFGQGVGEKIGGCRRDLSGRYRHMPSRVGQSRATSILSATLLIGLGRNPAWVEHCFI